MGVTRDDLWPLKECITDVNPSGSLAVLYAKKEGYKVVFEEEDKIQAYLRAAEILIENLTFSAIDDLIVYPLLNIYIHILEFALKFLAKAMYNHAKFNATCFSLPREDVYVNAIQNHDLNRLFKVIDEMMQGSSGRHIFNHYEDIREFVKELDSKGITVYSTRYILQKNREDVYSLHNNQVCFDFVKLHENIEMICNALFCYLDDVSFVACVSGDITQEKIDDLKFILQAMNSVENNFNIYNKEKNDRVRYNEDGTLNLTETMMAADPKIDQKFIEDLRQILNSKEEKALAVGMYGYRLPHSTISERSIDEDEFYRIVTEKHNLFFESKDKVAWYINFLEQKIKQ
jgi:hypothetical protein